MPPEADHRRRAVAGDVRAASFDDVREVPARQKRLDELLPNSRFMNELEVIFPMNPALLTSVPSGATARSKNRSKNGTVRAH